MGCCRCCDCGGKFEGYDADEYAEDNGLDEPDYETCPDCLEKAQCEVEQEEHMKRQEVELTALRAEVKSLKAKLAAATTVDLTKEESKPPAAKKAKVSQKVWVIVKGDWPDHPNAQLVEVDVLGTYSSAEKAEAAKQDFLEEGGWEEGYGYHQGESESTIEIICKTVDEPAH